MTSDILSKIETYENRHSTLGTELYALSEERRRFLVMPLVARFKALFAPLPIGLRQMRLSALKKPGTRFAHIDLRGPNAYTVNGSRLVITTFVVRREGRNVLVLDEATGEVVGRLAPSSLDWRLREQDETDGGSSVPVWSLPAFSSPDMNFMNALLPLEGLALRHPAFRRMADFARRALRGEIAEIESLRALDARVGALLAEQDAIAARALAEASEGLDVEALEARHAEVIRMMRNHDWTWREADRPDWSHDEREDRMLAALAALPEREALLLWLRHSYGPFTYATWSRAKARFPKARVAA